MIRLLIFLSAMFLSAPVCAETVPVRSGDHSGFSRLLLDFDLGPDWSFGRVEGGFEFRADRKDLVWDVSRVFELISRGRIRDVEDRGQGRLFLSVDCPCHADAFVLRDGQVALDIKDGPPPFRASPFEARLDIEPPSQGSSPPVAPKTIAEAGKAAPQLRDQLQARGAMAQSRLGLPLRLDPWVAPADGNGPNTGGTTSEPEAFTTRSTTGSSPDERLDRTPDVMLERKVRIGETERALVEQIARAATQGLIDADMTDFEDDLRNAPLAEPIQRPATPAPSIPDPAKPPAGADGHIAVETAIDRSSQGRIGRLLTASDGSPCLDPQVFDIANWGGDVGDGSDLGAYRSRLLGEFDVAEPDEVTGLVRHYLFLTFGAEARALMEAYPASVDRPDILSAMADIMDDGYTERPGILAGQLSCKGPNALWAVLAEPHLPQGHPVDTDAIVLSFSGLPAHLRDHLGPVLADRFLEASDLATAERIRNAIARGEGPPNAPLGLLNARLDRAAGDAAGAAKKLETVIAAESDVLAEALLERVDASLAAGKAVPPDEIQLLQSLAYENRYTELEISLTIAEVRARAASGDLTMAFVRLDQIGDAGVLPPDRQGILEEEALVVLARDAADDTFLKLAGPRLDRAAALTPPARREIAARLLDLGFSQPARRVLAGRGTLPEPDDRLLFARAALMEGEAEVAMSYLAGIDDADANRLRAKAMQEAGDYRGAARTYAATGDLEAATRAKWLGGLWPDLSGAEDAARAAAARLMVETASAEGSRPDMAGTASQSWPGAAGHDEAQATLARSQDLLNESKTTRAILDDLLKSVAALPDDAGS